MCYYNGIRLSRDEFIRIKEIEKELKILNSYRPVQSGFNYSDWPILKPNGKADFELVNAEWGFIPPSNKWPFLKTRAEVTKWRNGGTDPNTGKFVPPVTTLNAIGEEMLKPGKMFRDAALKSRCLVLSSHFFEWRHESPLGKKGQPLKTKVAYPYCISLKEKNPFFMAGITSIWTDQQTGETVETLAITTTASNEMMTQIHNTKKRQPTILPEDLAYRWLFDDLSEDEITKIVTYQLHHGEMHAYTVAKNFRESADPLEPFKYEGLSELITV